MSVTFNRLTKGCYRSNDYRFFLEFVSSIGTWRLREAGELVGYKPSASRTALPNSPVWYRSNSARAAVAWAKHRLVEFGLRTRAEARKG